VLTSVTRRAHPAGIRDPAIARRPPGHYGRCHSPLTRRCAGSTLTRVRTRRQPPDSDMVQREQEARPFKTRRRKTLSLSECSRPCSNPSTLEKVQQVEEEKAPRLRGFCKSPLPDSNRRPPLYEEGPWIK
jgi:hypothetical protein